MTGNRLSSLEGLADNLAQLHELYAADNALTSLAGLAAKATALETLVRCRRRRRRRPAHTRSPCPQGSGRCPYGSAAVTHVPSRPSTHPWCPVTRPGRARRTQDVSSNRLSWAQGGAERLVSDLAGLPELTWVYLQGNPGLPAGHQVALLAGLPQLDGVDELARAQAPGGPDVWVNPGAWRADSQPCAGRRTAQLDHTNAAARGALACVSCVPWAGCCCPRRRCRTRSGGGP